LNFQWLFQSQAARNAQKVFSLLDEKLNPRLFLLGIALKEEREFPNMYLQSVQSFGFTDFHLSIIGRELLSL
jgi:hypothetical protein